jgi:hypothetical protein
MRKVILPLLLFCFVEASAQDSLLLYNRWQAFFKDYTKEQYASYENEQFNKKFKYNEPYNCLVIFKDSTKAPMEIRMPFTSIENLCDPKANLEGKSYKTASAYSIAKKTVKYFVFDDVPFVIDHIVRKQYKIELSPDQWSVLLIDGPVRYTKYYKVNTYSSGAVTASGLGRIQKYEDDIGSDLNVFGGFSFKKFAVKTFSDYPELVAKINADEEGYGKKNVLKIITEYNEWVRKSDPEAFKKTMMFADLIKGSMADAK